MPIKTKLVKKETKKKEKTIDSDAAIDKIKSQDISEVKAEGVKLKKNVCVVCSIPAEYCMRGLPDHTYCKKCAKDYFKLLGYLDKL